MLLFVAIVAVVIALWHRSSQRQEMLVESIREFGGNVAYDWQIDLAKHDFIPNAAPPYPKWLVNCIGENYFYSVYYAQVDLSQDPKKPIMRYGESLHELNIIQGDPTQIFETAYLPNLRRLEVWIETPLDLSFVADLSSLEHLSIQASQIQGLSTLKGLRKLRYLHLTCNELQSPDLLGELTQLTSLGISPLEMEPPLNAEEMNSIYSRLPNLTIHRKN